VVVFATALILVAGLVVDGGIILAANRWAGAEADAAARAGNQALDTDAYRAGRPLALDPARAVALAQAYPASPGHAVSARVEGADTVDADVTFSQPLAILGIIGIGPVAIHGHGQARFHAGVGAPSS
jgi:hypothetical protein